MEKEMEKEKTKKMETSYRRSKAELMWNLYKRIIMFPTLTTGAERKIGITLYILCFAVACILVLAMAYASDQSYTDYKMEAGTGTLAIKHRAPDIVACPARPLAPKYKFNVMYNETIIENLLKMKASEVDEVTEKKFQNCPKNKPCLPIKEDCVGKFAGYCDILHTAMNKEFVKTESPGGVLATPQKELLKSLFDENGKKWSLDMLWTSIISYRYTDHHPRYRDFFNSTRGWEYPWTMQCFSYGSLGYGVETDMCRESVRNMWVKDAYCGFIPGSGRHETDTPYIGFDLTDAVRPDSPMRFWLGSLETVEMTEDNFISNHFYEGFEVMPTISGVIHYSMTEINDQSKGKGECQTQPLVAGITLPCIPASGKENIKWFYEFSYQNRPIPRVWIYAKTKQMITKKNSFTTYTHIQFAASLFSCFLGLSVMQILQVILNQVIKVIKAGAWIEKIIQIILFIALLLMSIILTTKDLTTYFENRYSSVFKEKEVPLPVPMIQMCNDWHSYYGFINVTKFRDFKLSMTFASYIRYMGFQMVEYGTNSVYRNFEIQRENNETDKFRETLEWMVRNMENGAEVLNNCSIPWQCHTIYEPLIHFMLTRPDQYDRIQNMETHLKWSEKMRGEAIYLGQMLGYPTEPSLSQLMAPFFLDPKLLVKQCMIGGNVFDCGKYTRYMFETGYFEFCIVIEIPKEEASNGLVGVDNALTVTFDVNEYRSHSDMISYYGPDVSADEIDANATCQAIDSSCPEGWEKRICRGGRSWKLKMAYPEHYTRYIQIQHPEIGLAASESHIVDLRMNFEEKLDGVNNSACYELSEIPCKYPREETIVLCKGFQLHIWCGCTFCFNENPLMLQRLSQITAETVKCCTVTQLTRCYTEYLGQTKVNLTSGLYVLDDAFTVVSSMVFNNSGDEQAEHFANLEILRNPTYDWFKTIFRQAHWVKNETMDRFLDHVRKCFRPPCKQYTFDLFNYQNEKIDDGFINVTVFYGTKEAVGVEQVDRFDVAEFIGILMCGYSVTFGIGIVGLFELVYMLLKRLLGKSYETTSQIMHDHILKSAAFLTDEAEFIDENNEEGSIKENSNIVQESDTQVRNSVTSVTATLNAKKAWSEDTIATEEIPGPSNEALNTNEITQPKEMTPKKSKIINGSLMILALFTATCFMLILLGYFFVSMDSREYNADIIAAPAIRKPSVILCTESKEKNAQLQKALGSGKCKVHWGKSTDCRDYFNIYVRNAERRFCYVWDNNHASTIELNQNHKDLILDANEDMPEVLISVQGFSRTSLVKVSPYIKWKDQNILMGYITKLKLLNSACKDTQENKTLQKCPPDYQEKESPFSCGLSEGILSPLEPDTPCSWFQYSNALSYSDSERSKNPNSTTVYKRLEVKPSQNNVLVFSVKTKHDATQLLSIVGGFVGSFTEITILSLLALILLAFLRISTRQ